MSPTFFLFNRNDLEGLKDAVLSLSSHVSHGASEDAAASINAGKLYKSNKNMLNIMENIHLIEEELTDLHELEVWIAFNN